MSKIYGPAEEVENIAANLIPSHHPELATARMEYILVSKGSKKNGKPVLGKSRKVSGAWEYLTSKDFILEVAMDTWNDLDLRQRTALVDHLLECCTGTENEEGGGEMIWSVREPELREFSSILHRHGAWTEDLAGMVEISQRLNLEARVQEVADVADSVLQTSDDA